MNVEEILDVVAEEFRSGNCIPVERATLTRERMLEVLESFYAIIKKKEAIYEVWVLTSEYNDYDQYGEYFEEVFKEKPTLAQLEELGLPTDYAQSCLDNGGERIHVTTGNDQWWHLRKERLK